MKIEENFPLRQLNTFGIEAFARYFAAIKSEDELIEAVSGKFRSDKVLVIGDGSNIVFKGDFDGLVMKSAMRGIRIIPEHDLDNPLVEAHSGESWQNLVDFALSNGLYGIENLAAIPGSVGAAPVQNIGAYGVEIRDVLHSVEAIDIRSGKSIAFSNSECEFGYRHSIFKGALNGRCFVTKILLKLSKTPSFKIDYSGLRQKLSSAGSQLSARLIAGTIEKIRRERLPDPSKIGNCGSFFKNCLVTEDAYNELKCRFPAIPGFEESSGLIKIPSAWLIEECGWKGYRRGDAAVYPGHALILVNYGNAAGADILTLAEEITGSVYERFGLMLELEAQVI